MYLMLNSVHIKHYSVGAYMGKVYHWTNQTPWKLWKYHNTYAVYPKNFHDSSDICPMGFMYSIQIREISHQTFGPSHRKCPTCPMIFVNTAYVIHQKENDYQGPLLLTWFNFNPSMDK